MAPISRDTIRAWNREGFAQIIRQLHGQRGLATILVGAAEDAPELESIRDTCPDIPVHVCAGTLNFAELAAMARHSEVFIGVESGPLHIAMAAGIPSVCIMGGGLFGQFFPYGDRKRNRVAHKPLPCYGCQWKCIHETVRCLQEITTGRVWREVEIALEAR
jgi:ADP-heptose:LPS heptosyltransferase